MRAADKQAMRARQRSIDNAVDLLKKKRGFAGAQAQAMRQGKAWQDGLSEQEMLLATPQRLQAVLRLLDIRAAVYLGLVDDMASQEAFMAMVNSITDKAWHDCVGFSVYQAPPIPDDPYYKSIADRGSHWVSEGYERVDAKEKESGEQQASKPAETPEKPTVFISYSWDDEPHKKWVLDLATRLRGDGVDAIIDQTHLEYGGDTPEFMESSIRESRYVLVVCTDGYKKRFDGRKGGAGYEGHIITAQMLKDIRQKLIPLLRRGEWATSIPTALEGILGADLRGDSEEEYKKLVIHLRGARSIRPVRTPPDKIQQATVENHQASVAAAPEYLSPKELALISQTHNHSLNIWLENRTLDPMDSCRFTLTNLQRFSAEHKDFERNPFSSVHLIKAQTINAGHFTNEAAPLAAFQDTQQKTLVICRQFIYHALIILMAEIFIEGGGRSRTETYFLSWRPGEDPTLIDDPRLIKIETPEPPFITPPEYWEQRKRLPDSGMMMKIWAKPRWCIWSRPEHFRKARFRDLDHCAQFVANASVHSSARWTQYPWFSSTPEYGDESVAGEVELDDSEIKHLERWVLFRSGQFVHNLALDDMPVLSGRTHVLEILNIVTAVFEFIGRMADQKLLPHGNRLRVSKGRRATAHMASGPFKAVRRCGQKFMVSGRVIRNRHRIFRTRSHQPQAGTRIGSFTDDLLAIWLDRSAKGRASKTPAG
jgi:hypothetical protein